MKLRSLSIALLTGVVVGALATHFLTPSDDYARFSASVPTLELDSRQLSTEEAEQLRASRYDQIRNIEDVLALPREFARSEALYALAGRSDSGKIQDLIYQVAGIADTARRNRLLAILLARLTELDPKSALAISRTPAFGADESIEQHVWAYWARFDLVAAVEAASSSDAMLRQRAAQGLYLGIDDISSPDAVFIENALGIDPGIDARSRYLRQLATESDDAAVIFIESTSSPLERRSLIAEFARIVAERSSNSDGAEFGNRFTAPDNQRMFSQMVAIYRAQLNPEEALAAMLAEPDNRDNRQDKYAALMQLASQDAERALEFVESIQDPQRKAEFLRATIMSVAASDPQLALEWARQNDGANNQEMLLMALSQIAQTDPQLALAESQSLTSSTARDRLISRVGYNMVATNPAVALDIIAKIENATQRESATGGVLAQWAQADFESTVNWLDTLDEETRTASLRSLGEQLAGRDITSAIKLVERFPSADTPELGQSIVSQIARKRGLNEAQAYIERYRGKPEFASMQYSAITAAARHDADAAMLAANRLAEGSTRDRAISNVISTKAKQDPQGALQWLPSITDADRRVAATGRITKSWYKNDPKAAVTWINSLQDQQMRDDAIVALASNRTAAQDSISELMTTIADPGKRRSAMLLQVQSLAVTDPVRAEQMLNGMDLNDRERSHYKKMLDETVSR